jgi:multicomponent Na+:H+ antiporter subunit C
VSGQTAYLLASVAVFVLGVHGVLVRADLVRKIVAANLAGSGVFLLLVTLAARPGPGSPDPVPHAMVLTGIVVAVSFTGLAVALVRRLERETGERRLPEEREEEAG